MLLLNCSGSGKCNYLRLRDLNNCIAIRYTYRVDFFGSEILKIVSQRREDAFRHSYFGGVHGPEAIACS